MTRVFARLLGAVLLCLLVTGCMHTPVTIVPSTKPLAPDGYRTLRKVQATDCAWALFGIIPVSSGNHLYGALDEAIEDGGGDALIQVTSETFFQHFIVISRYCTQVNGIAVKSLNTPPMPAKEKD